MKLLERGALARQILRQPIVLCRTEGALSQAIQKPYGRQMADLSAVPSDWAREALVGRACQRHSNESGWLGGLPPGAHVIFKACSASSNTIYWQLVGDPFFGLIHMF